MKSIITFLVACTSSILMAQPILKVAVSADTIRPGELVELTYTIENGDGKFEAPDFQNVPILSGPNTSSSVMIANGKKSSSQSYSYILRPKEEGKINIPEAYYSDGGKVLKIDKLEIMVLDDYNKSIVPPPPDKPTTPAREKRKF